jgi:hypothetical protein
MLIDCSGLILKCLVTFIPWYAYIIRTVVITIVDVTLETIIPVNIAKLVYVDKTNVINISSLSSMLCSPRKNVW